MRRYCNRMSSLFLPVGQAPAPHWVPTSYVSPCFAHLQSESTARCLSKTQVALHLQKAYYEQLAAEAKEKEQAWNRQKAQMEDQLRCLKVRNMEAERLFKIQEKQLDDRLERTQDKLGQLEHEHKELRDTSAEQLAKLRADFGELQKHCDALEHERQALKHQLGDADITAAARKAAEQKVGHLQDTISGMKQRTERVMADLQRKKDDAEQARDLFHHQLAGTQQQLQQEEEARKASDQRAMLLTLDWQRMGVALQLERLINEPLRHTDHTTTTTAHVLSSYAAPVVADRFRDPSAPPPPWPAPSCTAPTAPAADNVAGPSGSTCIAVEDGCAAGAVAAAGCLERLACLAQAGVHASSFLVPELDRKEHKRGCRKPYAPAAPSRCTPGAATCAGLRSMSLEAPLRHNDLTRLSRAWATTTPTAGFPHPTFLDNEARYKESYKQSTSKGAGSRPSSQRQGLQKPSGAIRATYYDLAMPVQGKQARAAQPQGRECKHWAP